MHIQTADSEETMNMVLANEVEMGFIGKKPLNKKLISEPLWHDRLVLAVPGNHPWRKKKSVALEELSQEPFVAREKGYAETLLGRRRYLHNINSSNRVVKQFEERVAINMPILIH